MHEEKGKIVKKWIRPGDRNPNVNIYGIETDTGHIMETCGNYGNFQTYPDPIGDWEKLELGEAYVLVYGSKVSYPHDTLIGAQV